MSQLPFAIMHAEHTGRSYQEFRETFDHSDFLMGAILEFFAIFCPIAMANYFLMLFFCPDWEVLWLWAFLSAICLDLVFQSHLLLMGCFWQHSRDLRAEFFHPAFVRKCRLLQV